MPQDDPPADVRAQIAHILERFHETHRRELPVLVALARELGASGAALAGQLSAMSKALEQHMFKEEMRLFPMMEQGGSTLIGLLIEDLARDHRAHDESIAALEALTRALPPPTGRDGPEHTLRTGVASLVADLREHMRLEDDVLFPRFLALSATAVARP